MCKLSNYISLLFLIGGGCLLILGGWQLYSENTQVNDALNEAKVNIEKKGNIMKQTSQVDNQEQRLKLQSTSYKKNISIGESIGILLLPTFQKELPIVQGTNDDQLAKGVGHYPATALPGDNNQILLSGHRDTVFKQLGDLQPGDEIIMQMPNGTFSYTMKSSKVVEADDGTIINTNQAKEELVLSTCYPFSYIGNAPQRYIVYATPTESQIKGS